LKLNKKKYIYLDLCSLERPYDDQSYPRIAAETAAVSLIMALVKTRAYILAYSPIHEEELHYNTDDAMRLEIMTLLKSVGLNVASLIEFHTVENRGIALFKQGFGIADALHVTYAEICNSDFVTCDDDLLRKCRRSGVTLWYGTPVDFGKKEGLL
jgi:hypothetical protein